MANDNCNASDSSPPISLTSEAWYIANKDYWNYDFDRYEIYYSLVPGEKTVFPYSEKSDVKNKLSDKTKALKFHKFSYQDTDVFRSYLNPERIKKTALQLKKQSNIFDLVAYELTFFLIKLTEHLLNYGHKRTQTKSNSENKIDIEELQIDKVVNNIKKQFYQVFKLDKIWENVAEDLLLIDSVLIVEEIEKDLGAEPFYNKEYGEKLEIFKLYLEKKKSSKFDSKLNKNQLSKELMFSIVNTLGLSDLDLAGLDEILQLRKYKVENSIPVTEYRLTNDILAVPSFAGIGSASTAQMRKDLWRTDDNGIAYYRHQSKSDQKNYIEHYITSPGDIELLPLEQAEQIIDKFGFNTVKLHLIFAAHAMYQNRPWDSKFNLKASDVIKYLGWDKRTDLPVHQKLNEIAKTAFVLDCLLVKSVWIEGRNKKGGIDASTPTGRMWNVAIDPRGEKNSEGRIEQPKEVYITVQPGLIFYNFLNKAGSQLRQALYQFGYLAQDILRIDPYHDELALRLAIHLTMESRVHTSGTYRVETLLKHLLPYAKIDKARNDTRRGYDLKQRWDNALKLLINLRWQVQFGESYPKWLQPGSRLGKPSDVRKMKIIEWLLQAKITIQPPEPIPELISAKVKPKLSSSKKKKKIKATTGITSDQIRKGRNALGWSQRKLAGRLGVSNALVGYWEKGKRTPSDEMEKKLRALLEIED